MTEIDPGRFVAECLLGTKIMQILSALLSGQRRS